MKRKKVERSRLLFLFILFCLIVIFLFFFYKYNKVVDRKEVYVNFEIGEIAGFDVNNSYLEFGRIVRGGSVSRNVIITNDYAFPIIVELSSKGRASDYLTFEKKYYLDIGEEKKILVSVYADEDSLYGDYGGKIVFIIKKDI